MSMVWSWRPTVSEITRKIFGPLESTPPDGTPLCFSCKMAFIRRDSKGDTRVFCAAGPGGNEPILSRVMHCTKFYPHNEPWLHEYEGLAWLWTSDGKGAPGFVRLRDLFSGPCAPAPTIGFGR